MTLKLCSSFVCAPQLLRLRCERTQMCPIKTVRTLLEHVLGSPRVPRDREGLTQEILWAEAVQGALLPLRFYDSQVVYGQH